MEGDDSTDEPRDSSRRQGIGFGRLDQTLEEHAYPTTQAELIDEYGAYELDTGDGSETFAAVLQRLETETDEQSRSFRSADAVRQAVFNLVGADAVGRRGYSDRGGTVQDAAGENEDPDDDSL